MTISEKYSIEAQPMPNVVSQVALSAGVCDFRR